MGDRAARVIVGLMALSGVVIGVWAAFDPHGFYASFPGGGRHWVSADGPYNEHLIRDFGSLNLALAVAALVALWRPIRELLIALAVANLAYGVPHLVYHLRHLDMYDTADKIGNVVALSAAVALAVVLLLIAVSSRSPAPERVAASASR